MIVTIGVGLGWQRAKSPAYRWIRNRAAEATHSVVGDSKRPWPMASSFRRQPVLRWRRLTAMSANPPKPWRRSLRLLLAAVAFVPLVIFFAWMASTPSHPAQPSPFKEPGSAGPRTASGPPQSAPPLASVPAAGRTTAAQPRVQRVLKYGRAKGEVGMVAERGQTPVGPESFAVGKDGSILVADVVNQRVVVYSSNGTYLHAIELPGIALGDVTADAQGSVYVYDQVRQALHQYDAHGTPQSALSLRPAGHRHAGLLPPRQQLRLFRRCRRPRCAGCHPARWAAHAARNVIGANYGRHPR